MPLSSDFTMIACGSVSVQRDTRQRREIDTKGLKDSIAKHGVINPIVVHREGFVLVAGERRLAASIELGLETIPCRFADQLDPIEARIIELEENLKRLDLPWQDIVKATQEIHQLYRSLDPDWTISETADALSTTTPWVSEQLSVARSLEDERVAKSGSVREAYNLLGRRTQRAAQDTAGYLLGLVNEIVPTPAETTPTGAQPEPSPVAATGTLPLIGPPSIPRIPSPDETILQADFRVWAPTYSGPKFNLIHCDFPYGIGVFGSSGITSGDQPSQMGQGDGSYRDDPDVYWELLGCLCANTPRLVTFSAHLMFWFSRRHEARTVEMLSGAGWEIWPHHLIWHKSDNVGIAERPQHGPRHVYETAIFASRARRPIVQIRSDVYASPTDKRFHPSSKPEPMLKHFFAMLVDENTRMLDPTSGGGSAIRAAEELGAESVLGLEMDPQYVKVSREVLREARGKRLLSARLG